MAEIMSRPYSKEGEENFDKVFRKKKPTKDLCIGSLSGTEYPEHQWSTTHPNTCTRCGFEKEV